MDTSQVEDEIIRYIRAEFDIEATRDAKLVRTGLLDSANLVQLAMHVERTFGVTIPDEDIDAEHMDSVEMIVEYLRAADESSGP